MFTKLLKTKWSLLILIVLIAGFLRFYQLGTIPVSLTWDEVAWGYNAYALSIDGRDEFGKFLPYDFFLSFGDYKPPVYAYLAAIPVMLFGLTEFAVRFPSALFGTISVLITFFLVKELFGSKENKLALIAAFLLAISPWHIMLSRAAFEANIATFFIMTGVWLFLVAVRRQPYLLILSTVCFIASIYTFNSTRIVAPLLFLCLAIGFIKPLWNHKRSTIAAFLIGVFLLLPIVPFLVSPEARLRYTEVNIFSDVNIIKTANQEVANDQNAWWSKIMHNRRVAYAREFSSHYFDHFNPQFLFVRGDENPKFSTQTVGELYLWEFPFLIIGGLFLFRKREKYWWILPVWLVIGIIPAATARETPHALRIESTLPTWQILSAYGLVTTFMLLKKFRVAFVTLVSVLALFYCMYFLHGYYTHYSKEYAQVWQYGYKEAVAFMKDNEKEYDRFYIANTMERGYVYTLFYLKYDPEKFRENSVIRSDYFGFVHVDKFDKYYFAEHPERIPTDGKKVLYIASPENVDKEAKIVKEFHLLDGKTILVAYTKEQNL